MLSSAKDNQIKSNFFINNLVIKKLHLSNLSDSDFTVKTIKNLSMIAQIHLIGTIAAFIKYRSTFINIIFDEMDKKINQEWLNVKSNIPDLKMKQIYFQT